MNINLGVSQGRLLGPLVFLIYTNDMIDSSNLIKFFLLCNDTVVLYHNKDIAKLLDNLNMEIDKISNWLTAEN